VIVYVESNFVLELALEQEEQPAAEFILTLAEAGCLQLRVPAIAICEPFSTVSQRARNRDRAWSEMSRQIVDLSRSSAHREVVEELRPVQAAFRKVNQAEQIALHLTLERLLAVTTPITISKEVLSESYRCQRAYNLPAADAVIYASVLADLREQDYDADKVFVSRNKRDFDHQDLVRELSSFRCGYCQDFESAEVHLRGRLKPDG
jgi:hypothetical protein